MSEELDDFQIKPLTEGLGFHKKAVRLGEKVLKTGISQDNIKKSMPSVPPESFFDQVNSQSQREGLARPAKAREAMDQLVSSLNLGDEYMNKAAQTAGLGPLVTRNKVEISSTLPRYPAHDIFSTKPEVEPQSPAPSPSPSPAPASRKAPSRPVVTGHLPISPSVRVTEQVQTGVRRGAHDAKGGVLRPAAISLPSIILDFTVVVALSLVFLVSLLSVTQVEVLSVAFNLRSDGATQMSLSVLFVAIMQMYVVVSRSFFGRTLGEWTFDFQMGDDRQHRSGLYPLLVAWRSFLIVISGLVVLPLLSLIFHRDLTARLSGLQLYHRH